MPDEPNFFQTIAMDPPWNEAGGGKIKRGADRHYDLVKTKDMPALIRSQPLWRPDPERCSLWLWATKNHCQDAMWVAQELGFKVVSMLFWVKSQEEAPQDEEDLQMGLGQRFRGACEPLLLCTMGKVPVPPPARRSLDCFFAPRGRHSAKPDKAYTLIETHDGPETIKAEIFARTPRSGWWVCGHIEEAA